MSKILVDYISFEDGVRLAPANIGRQQLTTASVGTSPAEAYSKGVTKVRYG